MTPGGWALVAAFGAAGALLRHEVTDRAADGLVALHVVNVAGSFVLGVVLGLGATGPTAVGITAGGLGALTSFSTWVVGAVDRGRRATHLLVPLALAIGAAIVGTLLGRALP